MEIPDFMPPQYVPEEAITREDLPLGDEEYKFLTDNAAKMNWIVSRLYGLSQEHDSLADCLSVLTIFCFNLGRKFEAQKESK